MTVTGCLKIDAVCLIGAMSEASDRTVLKEAKKKLLKRISDKTLHAVSNQAIMKCNKRFIKQIVRN